MSAPLPPADAPPEAVPGSAANSIPTDLPPDSDAILRVRRLQSDLRVLIRHFACRAEASALSVPTANGRAVPPGSAPRIALEPHASLLVVAPEAIARDGRLLGQLYESLEVLTDLAAPANVKSIRLTRAFVGDEDEDLPGDTRSQAQWLFRWVRGTAVFGILIFLATILLLVHVDRGRRAVQQLEQIRTEHQAVANSLGVARAASSAAGSAADYDCPQPTAPPAAHGPSTPAEQAGRGGQGHLLCAQMADATGSHEDHSTGAAELECDLRPPRLRLADHLAGPTGAGPHDGTLGGGMGVHRAAEPDHPGRADGLRHADPARLARGLGLRLPQYKPADPDVHA